MKRILILAAVAALALSCSEKKSTELYVPKNTVEFAGNAFTDFSLGADVKLYATPNPDNKKQWLVQAVVPVRKETKAKVNDLDIRLTPLDDRGIRIRDGFVMHGEDLDNMVPVYNSADGVERTIVFSVSEDGRKKYFSGEEAAELISRTKGVRMDFNVDDPMAAKTLTPSSSADEEFPMTLDGQLRKYGVYGLLARYNTLLARGDKKGAKGVEDQLWSIEKQVKNNYNIPEWLRDRFVDYIEEKEDEIEDRY